MITDKLEQMYPIILSMLHSHTLRIKQKILDYCEKKNNKLLSILCDFFAVELARNLAKKTHIKHRANISTLTD
jgi:hypothetical protein